MHRLSKLIISKLGRWSTLLVVGRPSSSVRKTSTYRPRSGRFPDLKLAMSGNRPPTVRQPSTWWTTSGRLPDVASAPSRDVRFLSSARLVTFEGGWFAYASLLLLPLPLRGDPAVQSALDEEEVHLRLDGGVGLVARELEEGARARAPAAASWHDAFLPHGGGHDRGVGTERFGRVPERISRS